MSRYDDIINLPHHVSANHPRMSMHDRAAQFAPFAALVGYDDAVAETALDEQEQWELNARLCELADHIQEHPEVRVRYFVPDERKSGGAIIEVCGEVKKLVTADKTIILTDGTVIPISDIIELSDI